MMSDNHIYKKETSVAAVFLSILLSLSVSCCSNPSEKIVGRWEPTSDAKKDPKGKVESDIIDFKRNNVLIISSFDGDDEQLQQLAYEFVGDSICILSPALLFDDPLTRKDFYSYRICNNRLRLEDSQGDIYLFSRIP